MIKWHFIEILEDLLYAYRKGHSCQAPLSKCVDDWKQDLDNNNYVGALFMDLSKAFDCLPHSLLISKLHAYRLTLPAWQLVASYLPNRGQRIKLGDTRSNWETVLWSLTIDGNHAIQWFNVIGMQANPQNFQFMLFSRKTLSQQCIALGNDTVLFSESSGSWGNDWWEPEFLRACQFTM